MTAFFAGNFDPPTLGHQDVLLRLQKLYPNLIVGVAQNPEKKPFLPIETRLKLLKELAPQAKVIQSQGLTAPFAKNQGATVLVRSIRSEEDLPFEEAMAACNKKLSGLETVFIFSSPEYRYISSTLVRQIAQNQGPLESFVPHNVIQALYP